MNKIIKIIIFLGLILFVGVNIYATEIGLARFASILILL